MAQVLGRQVGGGERGKRKKEGKEKVGSKFHSKQKPNVSHFEVQ